MKPGQREKAVLYIGAGIVVAMLVHLIAVEPAIERSNKLDSRIKQKKTDLREIEELKGIYEIQKKALNDINKRLNSNQKNFAIMSFLANTAKKVGIKENISKMKPSHSAAGELYKESSVTLKLDGVKLDQLVSYLYYIENSKRVINVKRLKVQIRKNDRNLLDATFEVSTFELIS